MGPSPAAPDPDAPYDPYASTVGGPATAYGRVFEGEL